MKTEARFLLAVFLMLGVLVATNRLFPPIVPDEMLVPVDSAGVSAAEGTETAGESGVPDVPTSSDPVIPTRDTGDRVDPAATTDVAGLRLPSRSR